MISKLFWRKKTVTVQEDGLIRFSFDKRRFEYQIYEPKTFFSTQRSRVKVYFDERNTSEVHLFDSQNRFLGCIEPRLEFDGSNEDIIIEHRKKRKEIDKYAKEQKKKWEGAKSQARKSVSKILSREFHDYLVDEEPGREQEFFMSINQVEVELKKVFFL
ncbi:MAG: Mu transposase C-terminal domain-containing protein [Bacteroidetes bacterium]|nr:Mu transposase C-terminal domain-containing protein [Bacteroidota bacterium]